MAKNTAATEQDRVAVAGLLLGGLARDEPLDDVLRQLRPFADATFPFPGDVLTEIAATALEIAGATPATPLSLTNANDRHLPEWTISGNTARQKHRVAVQAAIALHAGIIVDYDDLAGWWQVQDYTRHAFEASVLLIRVAVEHTERSAASICREIATRRGASLDYGRAESSRLP
jgi:hypothetical protein